MRKIKKILFYPFKWIKENIKDSLTAIIFVIVVVVLSSGVWAPLLIGFLLDKEYLIAIGGATWLFWIGPGTPFLVLSVGLTMGIKATINKIKQRGVKNGRKQRKS